MSPTVYTETTPHPHTRVRVHPERESTEDAAAILAAGYVAHVGFAVEGQPYVIPMTYQFDPAEPTRLYIHGAHHSRLMAHLATGAPVCVTVTLVDGLVYSRTALYHSVNYRSVVCFARSDEPAGRRGAGAAAGPNDRPVLPGSHCRARLRAGASGPSGGDGVRGAEDRGVERQDAAGRAQGTARCRSYRVGNRGCGGVQPRC